MVHADNKNLAYWTNLWQGIAESKANTKVEFYREGKTSFHLHAGLFS